MNQITTVSNRCKVVEVERVDTATDGEKVLLSSRGHELGVTMVFSPTEAIELGIAMQRLGEEMQAE